jgi:hypothetical protein
MLLYLQFFNTTHLVFLLHTLDIFTSVCAFKAATLQMTCFSSINEFVQYKIEECAAELPRLKGYNTYER